MSIDLCADIYPADVMAVYRTQRAAGLALGVGRSTVGMWMLKPDKPIPDGPARRFIQANPERFITPGAEASTALSELRIREIVRDECALLIKGHAAPDRAQEAA